MKTNRIGTIAWLLAAALMSPLSIPAAAATFMVSGTDDDAFAVGTNTQTRTAEYVRCGYTNLYAAPYYIGAFRFANVTVSNGATIQHAYLRVQAYMDGTGTSSFSIVAEA